MDSINLIGMKDSKIKKYKLLYYTIYIFKGEGGGILYNINKIHLNKDHRRNRSWKIQPP